MMITTSGPFYDATLIAGPTYNADNVLINQNAYGVIGNNTGAGNKYVNDTTSVATAAVYNNDPTKIVAGKGTGAATNGVIKITGTAYAISNDAKVYYIDAAGENITAGGSELVRTDTNDLAWAYFTDGVITTLYVRVVDTPSKVGASSVYSVAFDTSAKKITLTSSGDGNAAAIAATLSSVTLYTRNTETGLITTTTPSTTKSSNVFTLSSFAASPTNDYKVSVTIVNGPTIESAWVH